MTRAASLVLLAAALAAPGAHAQRTYTPRDMALLPSWCKYTQSFREQVPGGNNPAEIQRWMDRTNGVFHHLHHYCWGLMLTNQARLLVRDRQLRASKLAMSLSEFDYVIQHAPPSFILMPEVHTKKAENLVALDRGPLAVMEFERAITLKPDYWPAYAGLSDYYTSAGNSAKAREVLEAGLASVPDAVALKERMQRFKLKDR